MMALLLIKSLALLQLLLAVNGRDDELTGVWFVRNLHVVVEQEMKMVGNLLTDPQAIVEEEDDVLGASSSSSIICDDFNNRDELGTDWFDDTFNTLQIQDEQVVRDVSVSGWQYATYGAVSYKPEEPLVTVSVSDFDPLISEGSLGVALSLNMGGADPAPALVLVSDFINNQIYVVCSYANGESAWGNVVVSLEGDRNALGSSFTLEASMDATTGETQMRVTDIVGPGSPYAGKSLRFPCGVFPNHDSGDFGTMAGLGIFASDDKFTVAVDDFGHSGCLEEEEEEEPEPSCGTCSGSLVSNGVVMRRFFRGTCVSICVPVRLQAAAESLVDAECGTCNL